MAQKDLIGNKQKKINKKRTLYEPREGARVG